MNLHGNVLKIISELLFFIVLISLGVQNTFASRIDLKNVLAQDPTAGDSGLQSIHILQNDQYKTDADLGNGDQDTYKINKKHASYNPSKYESTNVIRNIVTDAKTKKRNRHKYQEQKLSTIFGLQRTLQHSTPGKLQGANEEEDKLIVDEEQNKEEIDLHHVDELKDTGALLFKNTGSLVDDAKLVHQDEKHKLIRKYDMVKSVGHSTKVKRDIDQGDAKVTGNIEAKVSEITQFCLSPQRKYDGGKIQLCNSMISDYIQSSHLLQDIERLEDKVLILKDDIDDLKLEKATCEDDKQEAKNKLKAQANKNLDLTAQISAFNATLNTKNQKMSDQEARIESLVKQNERLKERMLAKNIKIEELRGKLQEKPCRKSKKAKN